MKSLMVGLFSIVFFTSCFAQQDISKSQSELQWFTNKEEAQKTASTEGKNILMVFAGSDWCKPCIQFKKDILENEFFKAKQANALVVLYLDFPARKKNKLSDEQTEHNEALANKFNRSGTFPKIILLDANLDSLKDFEFKGQSVDEFTALLSK